MYSGCRRWYNFRHWWFDDHRSYVFTIVIRNYGWFRLCLFRGPCSLWWSNILCRRYFWVCDNGSSIGGDWSYFLGSRLRYFRRWYTAICTPFTSSTTSSFSTAPVSTSTTGCTASASTIETTSATAT